MRIARALGVRRASVTRWQPSRSTCIHYARRRLVQDTRATSTTMLPRQEDVAVAAEWSETRCPANTPPAPTGSSPPANWPTAPSHGHGIHGVFVANQHVAAQPRRPSYWLGTFTASDHRLVVAHVSYSDPPSALREGNELPALYAGGSTVFAPRGSLAWVGDVVVTLIGAGFFGWWLWYVPLRPLRRSRRLRRQAGTDPVGALLVRKRTWPWARQRW